MPADRKPTAIVIGGGIGGLTAAAAALHHFHTVTLIDRDVLLGSRIDTEGFRETPKRRSGAAQYTQPHILLAGGAKALDTLVPGFTKELVKRGANAYDGGAGLRIFDFGGQYIRSKVGVQLYGASRRLINQTFQDMLIAQSGERLIIKEKTKVSGLLWEPPGNEPPGDADALHIPTGPRRATTADLTGIHGVVFDSGDKLLADIVIVSDGRKSQLPKWLKEGNVLMPETLKVDCKMNYASRWMRLPEDFDPSAEFYGTLCVGRGQQTRGGGAYLVEDRMVEVILFGAAGDIAPTDEEGWRAFAATLPDKAVADIINRSIPLTPVVGFAGVPNIHPQYHKSKLPDGLFVLGDAFMALNPVYGQGVAVAAMGAVLLGKTIKKAAIESRCDGGEGMARHRNAIGTTGSKFHAKQAKQGLVAWNMATGEDMRYADVEITGVKGLPRMLYKYMDALMVACHTDVKVWRQVLCVAQLLDPPSRLFSPRMLQWGLLGLARGDANKCRKKEKEEANKVKVKVKSDKGNVVGVIERESSYEMEGKLDFELHVNATPAA